MKTAILLSGVLALSLIEGCTQSGEAAETAGRQTAVRYCTLCARPETAATFCRKEASGKTVCLANLQGKPDPGYCSLIAGRKEGAARAVRCALNGVSEAGLQCEFESPAGRPPSDYSMEYCAKPSATLP